MTLDLTAKGPGQIEATVKGKVAPGFGSGDLAIKGTAQAALANAFIQPRAISGQLGFDLRLNGPLAPESLSGPVTLSGGRLADPSLSFALQDISARANLARGQAGIDATAAVSSGGSLTLNGTAALGAPYAGDLAVDLRQVTLRDPDLYETTLNGGVTVKGPLMGGAMIAGRIALSETELRVPSTGFGGAGGLPGLEHKNEPAPVRATRARAGLIATGKTSGAGGNGPGYGLDITLSAPSLFIRGRGLDVEMGGELRLLGSTVAVVPSGAFDLIRGRLEILGKRLDLSEAVLQMEGDLVPFIHIVASTQNDGITSGVTIDGPATDPVVSFTSTPELPQEEVLAQLLFGQGLQNLSAFQALQLANAVATLAGRGGQGVVSKLREGFGLDNLDVKTDATGGASVSAGKYLTKNIYSEVTVDQNGQSEINLNLDVSKSITLRAKSGLRWRYRLGDRAGERLLKRATVAIAFGIHRRTQQHRIGTDVKPHQQDDHGTNRAINPVVRREICQIQREATRCHHPQHHCHQQPPRQQRRLCAGVVWPQAVGQPHRQHGGDDAKQQVRIRQKRTGKRAGQIGHQHRQHHRHYQSGQHQTDQHKGQHDRAQLVPMARAVWQVVDGVQAPDQRRHTGTGGPQCKRGR